MSGIDAKRAMDLALGVPCLIVSLPVQAVIAWQVRRRLGSPALFRQTRPGLHGEPFTLIKFRSMVEPDPTNNRVTDEERMTPFGAWLRSTSLDELPTLWNVVKGEMSLVGPRPLLMSYLDRYSPEQARRHEVPPGMTGLAQIAGRNAVSWDEKFALDVRYVDERSLMGDLRILARTVRTVLAREGITGDGTVTMTEFLGSAERAQ